MLLLLSTPKTQYFHSVSLFNCSTAYIRTFQTSLLYIFTLAELLQPPRIFGCAKKCAGCRVHSCSGSLADISQQAGVTGRDRVEVGAEHRVHTQSGNGHLSGVHSIMMEKLAQSGESGGCTPTLFYYIYHHVQSCGVRSC